MRGIEDTNDDDTARVVPEPTTEFRRRCWRLFQRALDPLAPPRPLPVRRERPKKL